MSAKNTDRKNRFRSKTVSFRVSPEEWEQIETAVKLSGLTKQDYILKKLESREIRVTANPRVYKALHNELQTVSDELKRITSPTNLTDELLNNIQLMLCMCYEVRGK